MIIHMRYSYSDCVAQMVERDASNIKVVSSILTVVNEFFTFPVETHSQLRTLFPNIHIHIYTHTHIHTDVALLHKIPGNLLKSKPFERRANFHILSKISLGHV